MVLLIPRSSLMRISKSEASWSLLLEYFMSEPDAENCGYMTLK